MLPVPVKEQLRIDVLDRFVLPDKILILSNYSVKCLLLDLPPRSSSTDVKQSRQYEILLAALKTTTVRLDRLELNNSFPFSGPMEIGKILRFANLTQISLYKVIFPEHSPAALSRSSVFLSIQTFEVFNCTTTSPDLTTVFLPLMISEFKNYSGRFSGETSERDILALFMSENMSQVTLNRKGLDYLCIEHESPMDPTNMFFRYLAKLYHFRRVELYVYVKSRALGIYRL
jgi:hypothetical protein